MATPSSTSSVGEAGARWSFRRLLAPAWPSVVGKLRGRVAAKVVRALDRSHLRQIEPLLSPVERHLARVAVAEHHGLFHHSYHDWQTRRIDKLLELYGVDWFIGRSILELGCGHAEIAAFFADLGAEVLAVDGRAKNINYARLRHRDVSRLSFAVHDLEDDFSQLGQFDLIINFGLLYHLRDVGAHLRRCFALTNEMVLESVVCDSSDPDLVLLREENPGIDEESLRGVGSRPSPFFIERIAAEEGFDVERIFSSDLNSGQQFCYDWEHRNDGSANDDFINRRFWRFRRRAGG